MTHTKEDMKEIRQHLIDINKQMLETIRLRRQKELNK